jgi:hypothetical protein
MDGVFGGGVGKHGWFSCGDCVSFSVVGVYIG